MRTKRSVRCDLSTKRLLATRPHTRPAATRNSCRSWFFRETPQSTCSETSAGSISSLANCDIRSSGPTSHDTCAVGHRFEFWGPRLNCPLQESTCRVSLCTLDTFRISNKRLEFVLLVGAVQSETFAGGLSSKLERVTLKEKYEPADA